jgi:hypothetical protein
VRFELRNTIQLLVLPTILTVCYAVTPPNGYAQFGDSSVKLPEQTPAKDDAENADKDEPDTIATSPSTTSSAPASSGLSANFGNVVPGATSDDGREETTYWRVGMRISADAGNCLNLLGTIPVPRQWHDQQVRIVEEDISPNIPRVAYRTIDEGADQMVIAIPGLRRGEKAHALVTFEVKRKAGVVPADTTQFVLPTKMPRQVRFYLGASPYIETRHPKIKQLAKELDHPELTAWEQVEKIYDEVRERVEYRNGELKGAVAALQDGNGDCEELTSLFIAVCRAKGIPARTVWVPDHCYPEFYLEDHDGEGHWFPCQAAGTRAFGYMPDPRPILQKGDNFKVPEKKDRQRYVAEFFTGKKSPPTVNFVRELAARPAQ